MYLAIVMTARCNATCVHCSTSCGPERTETLPRSSILTLMEEAASLSRQTGDAWLHFALTGGEPFLNFPLLVEAVAHARRLGASVSCVSNAYWASADDRARALLTQLQEAGLDLLAVSTSRFHERFVKRSRVDRALRIARDVGLRTQLKFVRTASDADTEAEIKAWAERCGTSNVQFIPLAPALRAGASLPESEYPHVESLPQGPCPATVISIDPTGIAHTCCTPGAASRFYVLGDVHTDGLREIRDRFQLGGKQQVLRRHGPAYFARQVAEAGHADRLRAAYGDVCQLCTHIADDPVMSPIAEAAAQAYELQQLRAVLDGAADTELPR